MNQNKTPISRIRNVTSLLTTACAGLVLLTSGCSVKLDMDFESDKPQMPQHAPQYRGPMPPGAMQVPPGANPNMQRQMMAPPQMMPPGSIPPAAMPFTAQPTNAATTGNRIQQASYFTPSEPRQEVTMPATDGYPQMEVVASSGLVNVYPDEYLFDGGDRGARVHYRSGQRLGVETEDTFAEYIDEKGQQHVRPSNSVAVYSPRFAAVRTMSGPDTGVTIDRLASATDSRGGQSFSGREVVATDGRRSKAGGLRIRSRASAVAAEDVGEVMAAKTVPVNNVQVLKSLLGRRVLAGMQFNSANEAWLANRVQSAVPWTRSAYPIIQAVSSAAMEVQASFRPQEHIGIEDKKADGQIRIVKLADRKTAVQGDVITFTLQYQNVGDRELFNIRVIDNLTPRLEYVADSAGSDRRGNIVVEDNDEGSKILRFEIAGSLKGGEQGTIEFQARVK